MSIATALVVAGLGALLLVLVGRRERRLLRQRRAGLLESCLPLFDDGAVEIGRDGFPRLEGSIGGRRLVLDLIPDSMTIRRLPQLWLSVTMLQPLAMAGGFAVLARPGGGAFYSLTERFPARLEPPAGLPEEILIRGSNSRAGPALAAAAPAVAALLADPRVKEVAATRKGARAVFRAAEGERGPHLILRQSVFSDAPVSPADYLFLHDGLSALCDALAAAGSGAATSGAAAGQRGGHGLAP